MAEADFKIERGVPLPDATMGRGTSYPFAQMEVGDSFIVSLTYRDRAAAAASYAGSRNGKKFSRRKEGEGYRFWRVA